MGKVIYEQEEVIDSITFHLALSNLSKKHPGYGGGDTLKEMVVGYARFFAEELSRYEKGGVPERILEIMLMEGGRTMIGYIIGDSKIRRLMDAAREEDNNAES